MHNNLALSASVQTGGTCKYLASKPLFLTIGPTVFVEVKNCLYLHQSGHGHRVRACKIHCQQGERVQTYRKSMFLIRALAAMATFAACSAASATIIGVDLGTGTPPNSVGPWTLQAFDVTTQSSIPDYNTVASIPTPIGGVLAFTPDAIKATVGVSWTSWSHGYLGPVFVWVTPDNSTTSSTLTLPANATAFTFYYAGGGHDTSVVTVTSNTGAQVGPMTVVAHQGATGIGFYTTDPAEFITSVQIESDDVNFATAEFSISDPSDLIVPSNVTVPTLSQWSLLLLATLTALGGALLIRQRAGKNG